MGYDQVEINLILMLNSIQKENTNNDSQLLDEPYLFECWSAAEPVIPSLTLMEEEENQT
jgi:hypothetical protein